MRRDRTHRSARTTRAVNSEIATAARQLQLDRVELFCECGRATCAERVVVVLAEFDRVSADVGRFVLDDHRRKADLLLAREDGYALVSPAP